VDEADARALAVWSPSHGALIVDESNSTSIHFYPLPSGRYALSRTCEGPPEYSGRGGRQLYTHILIVDEPALAAVGFQPFTLYRDALALGYFFYQSNPEEWLKPAPLSRFHPRREADAWIARAHELGLPPLEPIRERLLAGRAVRFTYAGDRIALAECLIGSLPPDAVRHTSVATSLVPSSVRPFVLALVDKPAS
jgi:hypothetical protein